MRRCKEKKEKKRKKRKKKNEKRSRVNYTLRLCNFAVLKRINYNRQDTNDNPRVLTLRTATGEISNAVKNFMRLICHD